MSFALALWFFLGFDTTAVDALEKNNGIFAKLTGWSFAAISLSVLVILVLILMRLLKGLRALTGMDAKEMMHPR